MKYQTSNHPECACVPSKSALFVTVAESWRIAKSSRSGGRRPLLMGLLLLLLTAGSVNANEDEMMGFIVDNSISRVGHEFYRYFTERLRDTSKLDFNLVVRERPSARWGSLVWVEYEGRTLYRNFLAPNTSQLQSVAHEAADLIREEVARQKLENMFQDTFDLERDEL
ncbi:curli production assembly/transport component CsgE [Oceanisphaera litoralis]|uniref:curli production assembly/transport protein CsgE n=1 Tax=Oceanisphaera litoralis TaxID=225144 RepID=UPI00195700D8|nr:curli production assembly/transport protein CsgE [Oceanisphaera litoralis]MBM7455953.1 curli production assembly/transport component CsgE [Oceanisphaera litoralis]